MRGPNRLLVLFALLALAGCTTMVPRRHLPPPLTNREFPDTVKTVIIPLPSIETDPNEGNTYGGLVAILLYNKRDEMSTILAPQLNYNRIFGTTVTLYGGFYPSPGRKWEFNLSKSTHVNRDLEFTFRDRTFLDGRLDLGASARDSANGSRRFFGFGADSTQAEETNFSAYERKLNVWLGYRLTDAWMVSVGERLRRVRITDGIVPGVPSIEDRFARAEVPGISGFHTNAQRLSLTYSTLDSPNMATTGWFGTVWVEGSAKALGSTANYLRSGAEGKLFVPARGDRFITATRLAYQQVVGPDVPLLEQSALGGENTLRGFGSNRFIDKASLLFNIEERVRMFRWTVFGVDADWEIAPFLDVGTVAEDLTHMKPGDLQFVPGVGFRALVRPNIVGHIDVGYGSEAAAVFISLDYPF